MLTFPPRPNFWFRPNGLSSGELYKLCELQRAIRAGAYRDDLYDAREEACWGFFYFLRYRGKFLGGPDDGAE